MTLSRLIIAIAAVTGSCQSSVTPPSTSSSSPVRINTDDMSRMTRRIAASDVAQVGRPGCAGPVAGR